MAGERDRVHQLELDKAHVLEEVERYRAAAEATLEQLDWCIDYFARNKDRRVARALSTNRAAIRRRYLEPAGRASAAAEGR
jgi:hypothetical protein